MEPLYRAVDQLMEIDPSVMVSGSLQDVALRMDAARKLAELAKAIADVCELHLTNEMDDKERFALTGVGTVIRKTKPRVRVKENGTDIFRADLVVAVAMGVARDIFTGEIDVPKREAAAQAVRELMTLVNLYPGSLSAQGKRALDTEDYTETVWVPYIAIEDDPEQSS